MQCAFTIQDAAGPARYHCQGWDGHEVHEVPPNARVVGEWRDDRPVPLADLFRAFQDGAR